MSRQATERVDAAATGATVASSIPSAVVPRSGLGWLDDERSEAWSVYDRSALPDRADRLWRYTDPAAFILPADAEVAGWDLPIRVMLPESASAAGVIALSLIDALRTGHPLVREKFASLVPAAFGKVEALNLAAWTSGVLIHVPHGAQVEDAIRVVSTPVAGSFRAVRNLILMEEGAAVTIVDELGGSEDAAPAWTSEVTELIAGPGSRVRYVPLQRLARDVTAHRTFRARLERDAKLLTAIASFGGRLHKADLGASLEGPGAESRMVGLVFADGRQHSDHHTVHDHRVGRTYSDINLRVVLGGHARSAYTGIIKIAKEAPNCEAFQENRNLLLSDGCRAESIPELEILTDEVRCKHGAAVGPIDADQLFYLRSRGLTQAKATEMVVMGFLEDTLGHLPAGQAEAIREEMALRVGEIARS